ncbi:myotubularin-related protein DDB_G0290005 isoform X2 [Fagus crenata]
MKKRRSPSSFSSFQDPRSSSSSIKTTTTLFSDSEPKPKKLFLSVSDPTTNPPQSPEDARTGIIPVTPSSNTGLQVSDPTQSPCSGDVSSADLTKEDTPNSKKRLRRMKDRMREMRKWCEQVMREQEQEDDTNAATTKHDDSAPEFEESVYVERVEEGLTVHFKCPCGKGYQILLSGRNCYYKLM